MKGNITVNFRLKNIVLNTKFLIHPVHVHQKMDLCSGDEGEPYLPLHETRICGQCSFPCHMWLM